MPVDPNCIFCKIVTGQVPCQQVYRDEHVLAFLDIGPLAPGHLLVVPLEHYGSMAEMPTREAGAIGAVLPRLVNAVLSATSAAGVNVLQNNGKAAGQEVPHVHVHLIPRRAADGLGYRWNPGKYAAGEAEAVRDRICAALQA